MIEIVYQMVLVKQAATANLVGNEGGSKIRQGCTTMLSSLTAYLESIKSRDPAPRSHWEILLYPGFWAVGLHRVAHWLFTAELYFLARAINHLSRFFTAIDIHPGATIGKNLFIDHGFVVIGETAIIGDNVTIYQGATLGGTNPTNGQGGKRHPTIEDGVIISLGAAILGPITVGSGARIGANAVVTKDVVPGATMVGIPARSTLVEVKPATQEFVPYGTPCCEGLDPQTQKLELLQCQLLEMQKRLGTLMEERAAATKSAVSNAAITATVPRSRAPAKKSELG